MTAVAAGTAEYLQGLALWSTHVDEDVRAMWPKGQESSYLSPIDEAADAFVQAEEQLAFLNGPIVEEVVTIAAVDVRDAWRGRCVSVTASAPGYEGGALVFVLGGSEDRSSGLTRLNVLRRLDG